MSFLLQLFRHYFLSYDNTNMRLSRALHIVWHTHADPAFISPGSGILRLRRASGMPSQFRTPGTPVCRCGDHFLTRLKGEGLLERWA